MKGRYNIERGRYDFNFQSFISQTISTLLPGEGNYIEWTGDPFDANIHIDAQYTASRVSVNDLLSNLGSNITALLGDIEESIRYSRIKRAALVIQVSIFI
jgi:hypothetical protein